MYWDAWGVFGGIVVLMIFGGLAGMAGVSNENEAGAPAVLVLIGTGIAIFLFVLSVPAIIGGWGMLKFRPWARILMIIVSAFNLFHFPLGTALGIYGLIVLLNDETRRLFETGGTYVPAPNPYMAQAYGQPGHGSGYAPPGYSPQGYPQQPPPPPPTPGA